MGFRYPLLWALSTMIILISCISVKTNRKGTTTSYKNENANQISGDTSKISKPKKFSEVVPPSAKIDVGLFTIYKKDQQYLLEIPDSLLNIDFLVVGRISKGAANNRVQNGFFGFSGDQVNENVVQFEAAPNHRLLMRSISFTERSMDSSENGLYHTVRNSNLQPIVASFDIKAYTVDSTASIIDITDFLRVDDNVFFFSSPAKKIFGLGPMQADKSYIQNVSSYVNNLEMQVVRTYTKGEVTATFELNSSFVLLPKEPMRPRYEDDRVGYFSRSYIDFDASRGVIEKSMITRWRLEPKEKDIEKYLGGELVEPKKPIIYYIDPATPKKWIPYLIQGVNDWQRAFEKAGFKNAIWAEEAPLNNPEFSLFDTRHNAIVYKPSTALNASGPHIHDPRSGEILETHINWYHNIMQLLHDWYMVQAGPNDKRARTMRYHDSLMGRLLRYVCSHEVGHTLGLMHNFGSSSTLPVDSLRSSSFLAQNGFCPSIMDYARFNYVAQPQDSIDENGIMPRIGVYDEWAIEWGYRWLPQFESYDEEKSYMNKWVSNKLEKDQRLWYGPQVVFGVFDPRCQPEDLGDNSIKAAQYGIHNLKRVMDQIMVWTAESNADYSSLSRVNKMVISQFSQYVMHVVNNIGLYKWTAKTTDQKGVPLSFVPKHKQKEAVQFLHKNIFQPPYWLLNMEVFSKVGGYGPNLPYLFQKPALDWLLNYETYCNMLFAEAVDSAKAYTFDELLNDLEVGIWSELSNKSSINFYRRTLQKIYVERLIELIDFTQTDAFRPVRLRSDFGTIIYSHVQKIIGSVNKALHNYKDHEIQSHLGLIRDRLKSACAVNSPIYREDISTQKKSTLLLNGKWKRNSLESITDAPVNGLNCWENNNIINFFRLFEDLVLKIN